MMLMLPCLLAGDIYRCLSLWQKRSDTFTSALANYTLSTRIKVESSPHGPFCAVERAFWSLSLRLKGHPRMSDEFFVFSRSVVQRWQVGSWCDRPYGEGFDDQGCEVYLDMMCRLLLYRCSEVYKVLLVLDKWIYSKTKANNKFYL